MSQLNSDEKRSISLKNVFSDAESRLSGSSNTQENHIPGLLINITGDGKGKSTSAFGMVIRTLGWGGKAAVLQFVKSPLFETGELNFFTKIFPGRISFEPFGPGRQASREVQEECASKAFQRTKELLQQSELNLLVLDELNIALWKKLLPFQEVCNALLERSPQLNVCITGRYAQKELLDICDLVSDIHSLRHPYDRGIPARKGIDF